MHTVLFAFFMFVMAVFIQISISLLTKWIRRKKYKPSNTNEAFRLIKVTNGEYLNPNSIKNKGSAE